MKIHDKLDEVVAFIESARGLPMSSSVVVNKAELARLLEELRGLFPDDLLEAQAILERREQILTEAVANAERLLTAAEEEKQRLVAEEEVLRQARIEAGTVLQAARAESEHMAREIDGYVDAKLAHLEVSITKLLDTVRQGRDHLAEPGLYSDLAAPDEPEPPGQGALDASYERPELDSRPAFGDDDGQPLQYPEGYREDRAGGQPEQPGYPPAPSGSDAYEIPSGYRSEPYPAEAYQADPPGREPDPLTDDVWLSPAMPSAHNEALEPAEAPEPEAEFEPEVEFEAGGEVVEDGAIELDAPEAPQPDERPSPDEFGPAADGLESADPHDASSSTDSPAENSADSPAESSADSSADGFGDSPAAGEEPVEPDEGAERESAQADAADEVARDEQPVEAKPLNRG